VAASPAKGEGGGAMGSLTGVLARWERAVSRHDAPAWARAVASLCRWLGIADELHGKGRHEA
jgi:hypothetical protein